MVQRDHVSFDGVPRWRPGRAQDRVEVSRHPLAPSTNTQRAFPSSLFSTIILHSLIFLTVTLPAMGKRDRSLSSSLSHAFPENRAKKKTRQDIAFLPNKIATAENAARVDASPPILQLVEAVQHNIKKPPEGECVVYWMRMEDLRGRYNSFQ